MGEHEQRDVKPAGEPDEQSESLAGSVPRSEGAVEPSEEVPAGDEIEQEIPWRPPPAGERPDTDEPEVPEADAIEQSQPWERR